MRIGALMLAGALIGCGAARPEPAASDDDHDHAAGHPGAHGHHGHHGAHGGHHDFSDVARFAAIFDDPERDAWQRPAEVSALLLIEPGMTVADLGAGTGYFAPHLASAVGPSGHVLALDTEPNMVEHMRERVREAGLPNVEPRVVAPDDPGLAPGSADRVLIVDTWHHIEARDAYAAKLREALRPGGFVLVVDFTRESPHGPPPGMRLDAETVSAELRAGGLDVELVEETLPYQYAVRGRRGE
jgi:SAM-dependent methyltransferase